MAASALRRRVGAFSRVSDLLDVGANLALVAIAVESVNKFDDIFKLPKPILYLAAAYVIFVGWRTLLIVRRRRIHDHEQRESICRIFHWLYREMFSATADRRFTLFVIDPYDPKHIIPKVRFRPGHRELIAEFTSKARYLSGEGCTGRAWEQTGKLVLTPLPKFQNRDEFTAHYVNKLRIDRETVDLLSNYMVHVQAIYSYGFLDHKGDLLGIASIDVQGEPNGIDLDQAEKMIRALGPVLEAFEHP